MANLRAKEAFLNGCKHRRQAWVVISNGHCATFAEVTAEVRCLLEDYFVCEGQNGNLHIHAFSQVLNTPVQESHSWRKFSPTRISTFSPTNSPTRSENHVTSPVTNGVGWCCGPAESNAITDATVIMRMQSCLGLGWGVDDTGVKKKRNLKIRNWGHPLSWLVIGDGNSTSVYNGTKH